MLNSKIITVYFQTHTKHTKALSVQNTEFWRLKPVGHKVTTGIKQMITRHPDLQTGPSYMPYCMTPHHSEINASKSDSYTQLERPFDNSEKFTNNFTGNKLYFLYTNVLSTLGDCRNGYQAYPKYSNTDHLFNQHHMINKSRASKNYPRPPGFKFSKWCR